MIETVDFKPNEEYFAAANGYSGFISNFDKEFNPIDYERVFILKGGPGTGKSTLMRGIGSYFCGESVSIKAIYCSSDMHSLDGVTLTHNGKSVCIVDGTAPHTTDPLFPGAKEEIINLGDGFNNMLLRKSENEIIKINKSKKEHYKNAYSLLKIAGYIDDRIMANYSKNYDYYRAEYILEELLKDEKIEESTCVGWQYISCFNKDGLIRLPLKNSPQRVIKISGNGYSEYLFMRQLTDYIKLKNISKIYYSPLSDKLIECLCTPHFDVIVDNADTLALDTSGLTEQSAESTKLSEYKKGIEDLAAKSFALAAESHFALEKIYTEATSFSHNEKIFDELVGKIKLYLSINI